MGHYYYYIDSPDDHDCMWSGDCCLISQSLIKQAAPDGADTAASGKLPLAICSGGGSCSNSSSSSNNSDQQQQATAASSPAAGHHKQLAIVALPAVGHHHNHSHLHSLNHQQVTVVATPTTPSPPSDSQEQATVTAPTMAAIAAVATNTRHGLKKSRHAANDVSRGLQVANKKLRHREVEKNRHRQLQAMVKNISERIPGRLDKETQVQTMKRAARYCLYLRDTMNLLTHGQAQLQLQKVYLKAWDSVELMSQC